MERLEISVRKKSKLFVALSVASIALFVVPLLTKPEYFYLSGYGVAVALAAIAVYAVSPKEKQTIAEIVGDTLRFRSTKNPIFGIGSLYLNRWQEFDMRAVTKILTSVWDQSLSGATSYICLTITRGSATNEVFVLDKYYDDLRVFLKGIAARYPSITFEKRP